MDDSLGTRIKTLRKQMNMSQKELGEIVNLHNSNIGRIENGNVYPTADVLLKLSHFFHVSSDWLLSGTEFNTEICNNADEITLLNNYRQLTDSEKSDISGLIEYKLYKASKEKMSKKSSNSLSQSSAS